MGNPGIPLKDWTDAELDALAEEMALNVKRMNEATDSEVIRCLIDNGCPAEDAAQQLKMYGLASFARQFYLDVQDAKLGNPEAKARVGQVRDAWGKLTKMRRRHAEDDGGGTGSVPGPDGVGRGEVS